MASRPSLTLEIATSPNVAEDKVIGLTRTPVGLMPALKGDPVVALMMHPKTRDKLVQAVAQANFQAKAHAWLTRGAA